MRLTGWNINSKPVWDSICPKCKFLFCISILNEQNTYKHFDIYESCSSLSETEYIIVKSNEPGDYISSVSLKILVAHAMSHMERWI